MWRFNLFSSRCKACPLVLCNDLKLNNSTLSSLYVPPMYLCIVIIFPYCNDSSTNINQKPNINVGCGKTSHISHYFCSMCETLLVSLKQVTAALQLLRNYKFQQCSDLIMETKCEARTLPPLFCQVISFPHSNVSTR